MLRKHYPNAPSEDNSINYIQVWRKCREMERWPRDFTFRAGGKDTLFKVQLLPTGDVNWFPYTNLKNLAIFRWRVICSMGVAHQNLVLWATTLRGISKAIMIEPKKDNPAIPMDWKCVWTCSRYWAICWLVPQRLEPAGLSESMLHLVPKVSTSWAWSVEAGWDEFWGITGKIDILRVTVPRFIVEELRERKTRYQGPLEQHRS